MPIISHDRGARRGRNLVIQLDKLLCKNQRNGWLVVRIEDKKLIGVYRRLEQIFHSFSVSALSQGADGLAILATPSQSRTPPRPTGSPFPYAAGSRRSRYESGPSGPSAESGCCASPVLRACSGAGGRKSSRSHPRSPPAPGARRRGT